MVKFWKYYKYYFCTLWKRPLVWLLAGGIIYAQYETQWQIQAMIYVGFTLLLPLAVASERIRKDYELDDLENANLPIRSAIAGMAWTNLPANSSVQPAELDAGTGHRPVEDIPQSTDTLPESFDDNYQEPIPSE